MKKILLVFLSVIFLSVGANAQTKVFEWNTDMCSYKGEYDSGKYSEEQINNTKRMLFAEEFQGISMGINATVWEYEEIADLNVERLDRNYKTFREELAGMTIVKGDYWENVRKAKLREFDQVYELSRLTMLGYKQPEKLAELKWADPCKKKYAGPIAAGGDSLLKTWLEVNESSRAKNADPERLKNRYETQLASDQRLEFALVEVMAFGWWNCVNEFVDYDNKDTNEREEKFKQLFTKILVEECEEP